MRKFEVFAVFLAAAAFFSRLSSRAVISVAQSRDLGRAQEILDGRWIWFGPESPGIGFLPGGLYYWFLTPYAALGFDEIDGFYLVVLIAAVTLAGAYYLVRRDYGREAALVLCGTLITMPLYSRNNLFFQSFSFVALPFLLLMLTAARAFTAGESGRRNWWLLTCFLAGAAIQLQWAVIYPLLALPVAQALAPRLKLVRLTAKDFAAGVFIFIAMILPFAIWRGWYAVGLAGGKGDGLKINQTWDAVAGWGFLYSVVQPLFSVTALFFLLFVVAFKLSHRPSRHARPWYSGTAPLRLWWLFGILALWPVVRLLADPRRHADLTPFMLAASLLGSVWVAGVTDGLKINKKYVYVLAPVAGTLVIALMLRDIPWWLAGLVGAVFAFLSWRPLPRVPIAALTALAVAFAAAGFFRPRALSAIFPNYPAAAETATALAKIVTEQTGWGWATARERLYLLRWPNPRAVESAFARILPERSSLYGPQQAPAGYFVISGAEGFGPPRLPSLIKEMGIPRDVAEAMDKGWIQWGHAQYIPGAAVLPYFVFDKLTTAPHVHNIGIANELSEKFSDVPSKPELKILGLHAVELIFRQCGAGQANCSALSVTVTRVPPEGKLHLRLDGRVGDDRNAWNAGRWGRVYFEPTLKFRCLTGPDRSGEMILFKSVALTLGRNFSGLVNRSIQLPAERWLPWPPCPGPKFEMIFSYRSARDVGKKAQLFEGQTGGFEFR